MSFLNKILLVLYKHYRKKNDCDSAVFHSKGILVAIIFANLLTIDYVLVKTDVYNATPFSGSKIGVALFMLPIFLVINYFTYGAKQLEENIDSLSEEEYKNAKFALAVIVMLTLSLTFVLPSVYGGLLK